MRAGGALGAGIVPILALTAMIACVACTALVNTAGLVGSEPPADAGVDASSVVEAGPCGATCAPGTRCVSSTCVPSQGLLAWWSFEQISPHVADVSGGGNDGASSQAMQASGKVGMGIELASNACVLVPDSPSLRLTDATALTMMAWVKVDACADVGKDHGIILNKEDVYEVGVTCGGSALALQEAVNSGSWDWHGSAELTRAAWQHVAVTWDGTTVRHYVDGQERDSHPQSGALVAKNSGLGIGCRDVGADGSPATTREWIAARIDEVAVYGRALTGAELAAYVQATR